jgi:hypothetical protein
MAVSARNALTKAGFYLWKMPGRRWKCGVSIITVSGLMELWGT